MAFAFDDDDFVRTTPSERVAKVWELRQNAWAFAEAGARAADREVDDPELRPSRHIVRVQCPERRLC
jgi:hypothetical protein